MEGLIFGILRYVSQSLSNWPVRRKSIIVYISDKFFLYPINIKRGIFSRNVNAWYFKIILEYSACCVLLEVC